MRSIDQDLRTQAEIYSSIISRIKLMYQGDISETQSHEAARNLIGLCQIIVDYQLEKQRKLKSKKGSKQL